MSRYYDFLRELSTSSGGPTYHELPIQDKAKIYLKLIEDDCAWFEEIMVGEGANPEPFIIAFADFFLNFDNREGYLVQLEALFYVLCDEYMYKKAEEDYESIRQRTAH